MSVKTTGGSDGIAQTQLVAEDHGRGLSWKEYALGSYAIVLGGMSTGLGVYGLANETPFTAGKIMMCTGAIGAGAAAGLGTASIFRNPYGEDESRGLEQASFYTLGASAVTFGAGYVTEGYGKGADNGSHTAEYAVGGAFVGIGLLTIGWTIYNYSNSKNTAGGTKTGLLENIARHVVAGPAGAGIVGTF